VLAASPRDDGYAAQFVASVARAARDEPLAEAARRLAESGAAGEMADQARGQLARAVQDRLSESRAI